MHVGLNCVFLVPGETGGMEVVARALVPALRDAAPALRFTAFVGRDAAGVELGVEQIVVAVRARRRAQWVLGEQALLPGLAARSGCDVVHSIGGTGPARGPFARVLTIYDLAFTRVPGAHFGLNALGLRVLVPLAARRSHRVLAPSNATADDVRRRMPAVADRVDVVELGPGRPPGRATAEAAIRRRLRLGDRAVVVSLAAKRPHKGLETVLAALKEIDETRRPMLVVPGAPTPYEALLRRRIDQLDLVEYVRLPGWLPDEDVDGLLETSTCLVLASLSEGFGLPVVEAMARGVPVACSDRAPLREIAGDAALLFDPADPAAVARAIETLLVDVDTARRLVAAGRARAGAYSWRRTAELTLASYDRALAAAR